MPIIRTQSLPLLKMQRTNRSKAMLKKIRNQRIGIVEIVENQDLVVVRYHKVKELIVVRIEKVFIVGLMIRTKAPRDP